MINFDFYSPTKIFFGRNRESEIGRIIKQYGFKKVLLHYGQSSIKKAVCTTESFLPLRNKVLRLWNWEESNRIPKFPW